MEHLGTVPTLCPDGTASIRMYVLFPLLTSYEYSNRVPFVCFSYLLSLGEITHLPKAHKAHPRRQLQVCPLNMSWEGSALGACALRERRGRKRTGEEGEPPGVLAKGSPWKRAHSSPS